MKEEVRSPPNDLTLQAKIMAKDQTGRLPDAALKAALNGNNVVESVAPSNRSLMPI